LLALRHPKDNATLLAARLRQNRPPVIARVERDLLLLDLRTVFEEQMEALLLALQRLH
jgi:L-seryl-tRNA(Ser) seleniumtransferase